MEKKLILITNDDGIEAWGIRKLALAASSLGEVWVVAPDGERSGISHSFTYKKPVRGKEVDMGINGVKAYALDGTPADCVRIGALKILPRRPDVVLAGINAGFNIASDIQYSGTIGAVLEAAFWKIPAIAFSRAGDRNEELIDRYLAELISELMDKPSPANSAWNVNFPDCTLDECKGIMRDASVSQDDFYHDKYSDTLSEDGTHTYMVTQVRDWSSSEGTDLYAVTNALISIGPVYNIH